MQHTPQEPPRRERSASSARHDRFSRLTPREIDVLELAAHCEPCALLLVDPASLSVADELVGARLLGKVQVRGDVAYRLTDLGRSALCLRHEQNRQ